MALKAYKQEEDCIKIQYSNESEIIFKNEKVVCIHARPECSEEEWQEAEECTEQTNMTFNDFLVEFGKVLEAFIKLMKGER